MILIILLIGALILGSFFTMLIYRLPLMVLGKNISPLFPPRSICPHCKHSLNISQLIPILGYISSQGRCKYCKRSISVLYPVIELLTVVITLTLYAFLGLNVELFFWLAFSYALLIIFFIDAIKSIVPDIIVLPVLWLGLLYHLYYGDISSSIYGAIMGYMSLWLVFWGYKLLTSKAGMGYGDFKMFALIGAWLGWQSLSITMVIACLCALGYYILRWRNPPVTLPLAAFMALSVLLVESALLFEFSIVL